MTIQQEISELASLLQIYLAQEHESKGWLWANQETFAYFKNKALNSPRVPRQAGGDISKATFERAKPHIEPSAERVQSAETRNIEIQKKDSNPQFQRELPASLPQVKAEPPKEIPSKKGVEQKNGFKLEPLNSTEVLDVNEIKLLVKEKFPNFKILDTYPSPLASSNSNTIKIPDILVLYVDEPADSLLFLKNMTRAIAEKITSADLLDAKAIEAQDSWKAIVFSPDLRLIVIHQNKISGLPKLNEYFNHDSTTPKFGKVPAILLTDSSAYQAEQSLKRQLWKTLQEMGKLPHD